MLLAIGLIFPIISLLSGIASLADRFFKNKHSSPVFVPFIGPILLTAWLVQTGRPTWLIPIVWCADIGTDAFLIMGPRLIRQWWETSSFTRLLTLHGRRGIENVVITLHSTGHYLLRKNWNRARGQKGIMSWAETGEYTQTTDEYCFVAHYHGSRHTLRKTSPEQYIVVEELLPEHLCNMASIKGWTLESRART